jgi:tRNA dimethylallyltransferase
MAGRGRLPIVCGGSTLYVHALVAGYELPAAAPDRELRRELDRLDLDALVAILERERPRFAAGFKDKGNKRRVIRAIEAGRLGGPDAVGGRKSREDVEWLCLATRIPREELRRRVEERLDRRLDEGMVEEVESLLESGVSWERLDSLGLEYRFVSMYLKGELGKEEMREKLLVAIRRFAKRQETWFRKMEREGVALNWIAPDDFDRAERLVEDFLAR